MNFELNAEQAALADSLSRLLADRYTFERRRALVAAGHAGGDHDVVRQVGGQHR
jgi:pimeloyl-CoA dehydrogenase